MTATDEEFRARLAARAIAKPHFLSASADFQPHPELRRIADDLLAGKPLTGIATDSWLTQAAVPMKIHVAARLRTIYRRIHRHLAMAAA